MLDPDQTGKRRCSREEFWLRAKSPRRESSAWKANSGVPSGSPSIRTELEDGVLSGLATIRPELEKLPTPPSMHALTCGPDSGGLQKAIRRRIRTHGPEGQPLMIDDRLCTAGESTTWAAMHLHVNLRLTRTVTPLKDPRSSPSAPANNMPRGRSPPVPLPPPSSS